IEVALRFLGDELRFPLGGGNELLGPLGGFALLLLVLGEQGLGLIAQAPGLLDLGADFLGALVESRSGQGRDLLPDDDQDEEDDRKADEKGGVKHQLAPFPAPARRRSTALRTACSSTCTPVSLATISRAASAATSRTSARACCLAALTRASAASMSRASCSATSR